MLKCASIYTYEIDDPKLALKELKAQLDAKITLLKNTVGLIMNSLYENCSTKDTPESNGLLLHAVYAKRQGLGIDECNIWGDYFYMEALTRLYKEWKMYW